MAQRPVTTGLLGADECSAKEIKDCHSAQTIKELLTTLHHRSNQCQKLQSEIVSVLQQQQYTEQYIQSALNDAKKRLQWNIQSPSTESFQAPIHCQVYSRSSNQWTDGIIANISTEEKTEREWLTVKYGDSKTKRIQRFCSDLKPIGIDDEEYIPNEDVMEYIASTFKTAQFAHSTTSMLGILEEKYNVVQLLDDIHHLKYDHGVSEKDDKFDEIFDFFKESMTGNECDINHCEYVQRHYRNRDGHDAIEQSTEYNLLMDTVSQIHCYFVHSFDIDKFSKADRQRMAQQKGDGWTVQSDILVEKRKRLKYNKNDRRARFQPDHDDDKLVQSVDFQSMIRTVGEDDVNMLAVALREYQMNQNRLIGDLIDVVFAENEEQEKKMAIWSKLKVNDSRKREIFQLTLCGHFNSNQISAGNMVKLSQIIIERKGLKIDVVALKKMINSKNIDGRIFDETNTRRYIEKNDFMKLFETVRDCDVQHSGELYNVLKDWLFIVYSVMMGLSEMEINGQSKTTSENARNFEMEFIDFFLQNPMGIDALTNMSSGDFADRMLEYHSSKPKEEDISTVDLVRSVLDKLKDTKSEWNQYEDQIIDFFRENSDIDWLKLSTMTTKEFRHRLVEHCGGAKKLKVMASTLKRSLIEKMKEKDNTARELSGELLKLVKERMEKVVDFVSMAKSIEMEVMSLSKPLNVYKRHPDRLIGDLIDVICNEDTQKMDIWNKFKMENHRKRAMFRTVLCGYFKCTDLNTTNFIKISEYIIKTKGFKIDIDALNKLVIRNTIDGRIFNESDHESDDQFHGKSDFIKLFDGLSECNRKHIGELYTAIERWNVIEIFIEFVVKEVIEEMRSEIADQFKDQIIDFFRSDIDYKTLSAMNASEFGKRMAKNCGSDNVMDIARTLRMKILAKIKGRTHAMQQQQPQKVYEIGKRFVFWQKEDKDFVKPKYQDIREELMESPLLVNREFKYRLISLETWNQLTESVQKVLETKMARKIKSSGYSRYIYKIQEGADFDAPHLRALKLYTDFSDLCDTFCWILRDGDPKNVAQIAHWTKTLTETVQCFGNVMQAKESYLRGVNQEFMFRMIVSQWYLPLSTTTSVEMLYGIFTDFSRKQQIFTRLLYILVTSKLDLDKMFVRVARRHGSKMSSDADEIAVSVFHSPTSRPVNYRFASLQSRYHFTNWIPIDMSHMSSWPVLVRAGAID